MSEQNEVFHTKIVTRLSAAITHDIRAPLNYVVKALQGICEATHMHPEALREEIRQVFKTSEQIYRYSDTLTNLAKIMLTNDEISLSPTSIRPLIQEQIDMFRQIATSNGTRMHNLIPPDMVFASHAGILSIAIHNLLDNATKFTKSGEISVNAEIDDCQTTYIKVVDTGVGINRNLLGGYNAHAGNHGQTTAEQGGVGLGLLLVKDVIQLIGGVMTIDSVLGQGTTVTLSFARRCTS